MPTPVGPAPRDPDDPDLWDWEGGDEEPDPPMHWAWLVLAAAIFVVLAVAAFAGHR